MITEGKICQMSIKIYVQRKAFDGIWQNHITQKKWGGWEEEHKYCGSCMGDVAWPKPTTTLVAWSMQHHVLFPQQESTSDSWHEYTWRIIFNEETICVTFQDIWTMILLSSFQWCKEKSRTYNWVGHICGLHRKNSQISCVLSICRDDSC